MQSDETVVRRQNAVQSLVNAGQQLIEMCRFIKSMDNLGIDLALGLHSLQFGHVRSVKHDPFKAGIGKLADAAKLNPSP